ncbi:tail fiber domain-containing protein [bacterium]|nr:tail fiber domain-containing protein [bacterium]
MKFLTMILLTLLMTVSCTERVVYVDRADAPAMEPVPSALYANCYVPGRGYLGDDGYYYGAGSTYRCNGMVYRSGSRYHGNLLGAFAVGYYYSSMGRGYGNYGGYHTTVVNVNNTTINKGSPAYKKRMGRYNNLQKKRNKNKWVSKSEKKRRTAQSKKAKKAHKAKMAANKKKSKKGGFFSKSSRKATTKSRPSSFGRSKPKRKSSGSSFSRSSSRSSSRRSGRSRRSDSRLKNSIEVLKDALTKLKAIRGVNYKYNGNNKSQVGVIAQEVEKVVPEAVELNEEGFRTVHYDLMVPLLIEAIKEQQKQIDFLRKKIEDN